MEVKTNQLLPDSFEELEKRHHDIEKAMGGLSTLLYMVRDHDPDLTDRSSTMSSLACQF